MKQKWLEWAQKLQALAQNGLTYSDNPFDIDRYKQIRQIAAEILATHSQLETENILDLFSHQLGYATPKIDVRGAVFRDNQILLVQERSDGCWTLPGGWADVWDTPSQAVVREIWEKSGYQTRAVKVLAVYDRDAQGHPPFPFSIYKLFFQCEIIGGSPTSSTETQGVEFFAEDNLPELSIGRVTAKQINRLFQHYHNQNLPTDFD